MHIQKNRVVSIRYIMKNSKEEILENTMNGVPVNYLHGSSAIHPLLQSQLEGLKVGDIKQVYLATDSGLSNDDFIFEVAVDEIHEASAEEVLMGYPENDTVQKCGTYCDCNK